MGPAAAGGSRATEAAGLPGAPPWSGPWPLGSAAAMLSGVDGAPPTPRRFNCHVVLDPSGETAAHYRKIHLFDVRRAWAGARPSAEPWEASPATGLRGTPAWQQAGGGASAAQPTPPQTPNPGVTGRPTLPKVDVPNGPILMESRTTAPGDKVLACAARCTLGVPAGSLLARCPTSRAHNPTPCHAPLPSLPRRARTAPPARRLRQPGRRSGPNGVLRPALPGGLPEADLGHGRAGAAGAKRVHQSHRWARRLKSPNRGGGGGCFPRLCG
jgi:hypothetical protein